MKNKLKKYCVSLLISCLLVPSFCLSLVTHAIDPTIIIESAVAAIELTVATANALSDSNKKYKTIHFIYTSFSLVFHYRFMKKADKLLSAFFWREFFLSTSTTEGNSLAEK